AAVSSGAAAGVAPGMDVVAPADAVAVLTSVGAMHTPGPAGSPVGSPEAAASSSRASSRRGDDAASVASASSASSYTGTVAAAAARDTGSLAYLQSLQSNLDGSVRVADVERLQRVGVGTFGRVLLVRHQPSSAVYALEVLKKYTVVRLNQ